MKTLSTALALVMALGAVPALAANARQPYSNIDRRNDRGNDTGDSRVEELNARQLDSVRSQGGYIVGAPGVVVLPPGSVVPPGGFAAPPAGAPMMGAPMYQPGYPVTPR